MAHAGITTSVRTKWRVSRDLRHVLQSKKKHYDYTLEIAYKGKYPAVNGRRSVEIPVAEVAAMLNTGIINGKPNLAYTGKVGRPSVKKWDYEKRAIASATRGGNNRLNSRINKIAKDLIKGKISSAYAPLRSVGEWFKGHLIATIEATRSPKLSPVTIEMRKKRGIKSTKPLEETGQLKRSIVVRVFRTDTHELMKTDMMRRLADRVTGPMRRDEFYFVDTPKNPYPERGGHTPVDDDDNLVTTMRGGHNQSAYGETSYYDSGRNEDITVDEFDYELGELQIMKNKLDEERRLAKLRKAWEDKHGRGAGILLNEEEIF